LNILVIYDGYKKVGSGGGVPEIAFHLARNLVRMRQNVTLLERKSREDEATEEMIDGVRFVRLLVKKRVAGANEVLFNFPVGLLRVFTDNLFFGFAINRWLNKVNNHFDIVQVFFPFASNILILRNRGVRRRVVYTFHGDMYRLNLPSRIRMLPWYARAIPPDEFLMKRVGRAVVLDNNVRDKILTHWKIDPSRVVTIPFGIDVDRLRPDAGSTNTRQRYGLEGKVTVLYAANLFPRKGAEYLVRAANILVNGYGYRDIHFLLAGPALDKKYASRLFQMVDDNNLKEQVSFLGRVDWDELIRLYIACDLFVDPSLEDNPNMATGEAVSCGRPVVGSKTGGMPLQVIDGWNGILVEPADEKDLAEKIKYLVDHAEERKRMGINSRQHALNEFSWEIMAERYLQTYRKVVGLSTA
jgi:glycosyltransferase involved in cell wall biosynthesis